MGCCGSKKKAVFEQSNLMTALHEFLRQGTLHLETAREDALAYEKLRLSIYEQSPLSVPVFDMALFISMSMECSTLLAAHERVRITEKAAQETAKKDFAIKVLMAHYRFSEGLGGFSQMCTYVLLTQRPYVCSIQDHKTQNLSQVMFGPSAVWMMEPEVLEEDEDGKVKKKTKEEEENDPRRFEIRIRKGLVAHVKGRDHKCAPLDTGIVDHFDKWLAYTRTFRSSLELPQTGNALAAAAGLLMEFDVS